MKANVKQTTQDKIVVRGMALDFNVLNENHVLREAEVEQQLEEKYPGILGLLQMENVPAGANKSGVEMAKAYIDAKKACREFFDLMFGEGTGKKLLGTEPIFSTAVEVFTEFRAEKDMQAFIFGQKIGTIRTQYIPVGPKGAKK